MKQLTQDIFKDAPWWAKSAAVDASGDVCIYSSSAKSLKCDFYLESFLPHHYAAYVAHVDEGYDPTDWQNSAIDREVSA